VTRAAFAFALALALSAPVAAGSPATKHVRGIVGTGLPTTGGTMTGPLLLPDGTDANPSLGFSSDVDTGLRLVSAGQLGVVVMGAQSFFLTASTITAYDKMDLLSNYIHSSDGILELGGNVTSARGNGTGAVGTAGNLEVQGALQVAGTVAKYTTKGAATWVKTKTESVTFANDASKVTAGSIIVDGAMIMGVSGRVTTTLEGCTAVDVGDGADADLFANDVALAAGSTFTNADATAAFSTIANGDRPSDRNAEITVTAVTGNCTAGVVALTVHYIDVTAATAN